MAATPMPKMKAPAAVDQALAGRRSLNATARKAPGPNMAGGGLNPAANSQTPPILSPAQRPPAWQALAQAGIAGQGSAAANRAAAAGLQQQMKPAFMPGPMNQESISLPGVGGGGPGPGDIPPGMGGGGPGPGDIPPGMGGDLQPTGRHPLNPGGGDQMQGGAPAVDLAGRAPVFGTPGQQLGTPGAMDPGTADNIRRMGGTPPPGAGAPPPGAGGAPPGGFNANLGADITQRLSALRMGQGSPSAPGGGVDPSMNKGPIPAQPSFSDFWASPGILPTGRGGGINPAATGGRDPMTGGIAAGGGFGYGGGGGGGRGGGAPGYY